jgi:hypothetical protein
MPVRLRNPELEQCCVCGEPNRDGIFVRVDESLVPYPRTVPSG